MNWWAVLGLAAAAYALKAVGFFGLSRVGLGPAPRRIAAVLPAAMLAALVVAQTVDSGSATVVWTRMAGVAAGAVVAWRRAPLVAVLIVAAAVAAALRWIIG